MILLKFLLKYFLIWRRTGRLFLPSTISSPRFFPTFPVDFNKQLYTGGEATIGYYRFITKSLAVGYDKAVIKDINIEVKAGEIASLIGPNGVGKTTFIKTVSGIIKPISGKVFLDGNDLENSSWISKVSLVN